MNNIVFYNLIGYPDDELFKAICRLLDEAGCEFIELGIPSSNPMKDGKTIADLHDTFKETIDTNKLVELLTWIKENTSLKAVLMTYYDGFVDYGLADLPTDLYSSILCVDNDLEGYPEIQQVKFYHKDMSDEEIERNLAKNVDFCYVNSGIEQTGETLGESTEYLPLLNKLNERTDLPLYVGFGIETSKDVDNVKRS